MLTSSVLVRAALLVAGLVWCGQMLRRWRSDLDEFRSTTDGTARAGIALPWLATGVIAAFVVGCVLEIVAGFGLG